MSFFILEGFRVVVVAVGSELDLVFHSYPCVSLVVLLTISYFLNFHVKDVVLDYFFHTSLM